MCKQEVWSSVQLNQKTPICPSRPWVIQSLIYIFSHITWSFTTKTFHYTCLKLYLLDLLLISAFFPALTDRHCLRSHYFSYKYTKLVSVLGLMLQLLTVTLVSATDSYSLHKNLCQSAYVFAGRLSSSLWEPKSTSHAGTQACTRTALNIITNDTRSLSKASKRALLFHRIMYVDFFFWGCFTHCFLVGWFGWFLVGMGLGAGGGCFVLGVFVVFFFFNNRK